MATVIGYTVLDPSMTMVAEDGRSTAIRGRQAIRGSRQRSMEIYRSGG
jgi:hypothetical protein